MPSGMLKQYARPSQTFVGIKYEVLCHLFELGKDTEAAM